MNPIAARLLVLALGLVICFRGYGTFRFALALTGFFVAVLAVASKPSLLPVRPEWLAPLLVLGAGLVAAILVFVVYRLAVVLLGAAIFVIVALSLPVPLPIDPGSRMLVLALVGLVGAVASRSLERIALSLITGVYGGLIAASALVAPVDARWRVPLPATGLAGEAVRDRWFLVLWLVLSIVGSASQLMRDDSRKPKTES